MASIVEVKGKWRALVRRKAADVIDFLRLSAVAEDHRFEERRPAEVVHVVDRDVGLEQPAHDRDMPAVGASCCPATSAISATKSTCSRCWPTWPAPARAQPLSLASRS